MEDVVLDDILPYVGDTYMTGSLTPRDSQWAPTLTGPVAGAAADAVITYSMSTDPCRGEINSAEAAPPACVDDWTATPATWADVKAIRIAFPAYQFAPGESLEMTMPFSVPDGTPPDVAACELDCLHVGSC